MEVSKRRGGVRGSVVAGSVWESRMKSDEVRGGIKVFNAEENPEEGVRNGGSKLKRIGCATSGKRKTWKSESSEGLDKNPIQVTKGKSESQKNSEEQCKELNISSSDGIKKSPIHTRKFGASADKFERSPIQTRKLRSETQKGSAELGKESGESGEGHERNSGLLSKSKSDSIKKNASGSVNNSVQLRKTKSELDRVPDESRNGVDGLVGGWEKIEVENVMKDTTDENCKDFDDVCQEKVMSSISDNVGVIYQNSSELPVRVGGDSDYVIDDEGDEEEEEEVVEEEVEIERENESFDVKEISIPESKET